VHRQLVRRLLEQKQHGKSRFVKSRFVKSRLDKLRLRVLQSNNASKKLLGKKRLENQLV
jgi:hypothetical protein